MILHHVVAGEGPPIVFLHGIAGSSRYWDQYVPLLTDWRRVIALDLLGFGRSPQSVDGYSPETQCRAIKTTLQSIGVDQPAIFVGHSMGALLALHYAAVYPDEVSQLVLVGMPVYRDPLQARAEITKSQRRWQLVYYGWTSRALCTVWCHWLRPLSRRVAPLYLPKFPRPVAADSVLHSWRAFSDSLREVIEQQSVPADLYAVDVPITLVYGSQESQVVRANARGLRGADGKRLDIRIMAGSHNLPLEQPAAITAIIK